MYRPGSPASPDDIDIATLAGGVWARRRLLIVLTLGAGLLTYAGLSFVTPLYTSQADILIDSEDSSFRRPAAATTERERVPDEHAVQSQVQVLLSRDLAEAVARDLELFDKPEFTRPPAITSIMEPLAARIGLARPPTPARTQQRVLDAFADGLSVFRVSTSRVIAIRFSSRDPELAAKVANRLAQVYLTWRQRETLRQTREASDWLSGQIAELRTQVEAAEAKVEEFRSATGLFAGQNNVTLNSQEMSELNSQLILASAQRSEAEVRARLIDRMLKDTGDVDASPDVLRSELIQRLLEQRVQVQRQLAELSATLLPSHPRIQQLRSELADLRQQIRDEARKIVRSLENESQIAGAREASLRASLDELKARQANVSDGEIKLRALEREAKANRDLLESYLARYRDASARRDELSVPAEASIISRAHTANLPSFPRKGPMTLLAMAAVAMLSFAWVLARELIAGQAVGSRPAARFHTADMRTMRASAIPDMAMPPLADGGGDATDVTSLTELADGLHALLDEGGGARVLVAGTGDGAEGPEAAVELARALAALGRDVALVELSAGHPGLSGLLALPRAPGIHDLATGQAGFDQIVHADPRSTVQFVPAGLARADMGGLVSILGALDATYDCVVLYAEGAAARGIVAASSDTLLGAVVVCDVAPGDSAGWRRALAELGLLGSGVEAIRYRPVRVHQGGVSAWGARRRQAAAE